MAIHNIFATAIGPGQLPAARLWSFHDRATEPSIDAEPSEVRSRVLDTGIQTLQRCPLPPITPWGTSPQHRVDSGRPPTLVLTGPPRGSLARQVECPTPPPDVRAWPPFAGDPRPAVVSAVASTQEDRRYDRSRVGPSHEGPGSQEGLGRNPGLTRARPGMIRPARRAASRQLVARMCPGTAVPAIAVQPTLGRGGPGCDRFFP